ncbi:MAG TPA: ABC transporter permease [Stellaceae bacterium]|nr:ABC transporter permease [Stellaceae bacterium]
MTAGAAARPAVLSALPIRNRALLALVLAAAAAILFSGFVEDAPNRLLSGRPISLWAAAGVWPTAGIAVFGAALLAAALMPQRRALALGVALAASLALVLGLAAAGLAARALLALAPPAARIALGPAFWVLEAAAAFAVLDALQRLRAGPMARLLAVALIAAAIAAIALSGRLDSLSIAQEYASRQGAFAAALSRHILIVALSVGPALLVGFPLGIAAAKAPRLRGPLFAVLNLLQTIPSVALFGLLIVPLSQLAKAAPRLAAFGIGGTGLAPALIALVLYALLPVVRNTSAGLLAVDRGVVEAGRGMGLSPRQLLMQVELPLALPVLLAGLRIVTVQAIGLAVVAALIGAGGLGTFVFQGLGQYAVDLVLLGALPAIGLALFADFGLRSLSAMLFPAAPR